MTPRHAPCIGTAGWGIPADYRAAFPDIGTQLENYSRVFGGVEINSSFHRPHRLSTYQKWADCVPPAFRFAVKIPKQITHVRKLCDVEPLLDEFLAECAGLGERLGPLLVQLPPGLAFDPPTAGQFLRILRQRVAGAIAFEPRNPSWFTAGVNDLFTAHRIARVAADPAPVPQAGGPAGWPGMTYLRLHGSPRVYHSSYSQQAIDAAMDTLWQRAADGGECWCIFDNTASGAATANALTAQTALDGRAKRT